MKEIRLHGIGGLGTVKAGEMLVHAAVASGKYGNSIPFFGFERQGAPVTSYVRLGDEKIRPKNQVYHPNCTLVLDPSLLISAPVFDGLTENSYFIVNTKAENGADLVKNPEIKTLALGSGKTRGVDADVSDAVSDENLDAAVAFVKDFAQRSHAIVAVTGAIDLVSDGQRCFVIRNGRPEMGKITGTGCQLSGMMTAFVVANPDRRLEAAAAAVCAMGLAGETGWSRMAPGDGNSTYRNRIIDAIYNMDGAALDKGAKYEVR